jgi:hypothetical protein
MINFVVVHEKWVFFLFLHRNQSNDNHVLVTGNILIFISDTKKKMKSHK